MNLEKIGALLARLFFFGAMVLLAVAIAEALVNLYGYTILRGVYRGGQLLEYAAVLVIFVIAVLLRQIRQQLTPNVTR